MICRLVWSWNEWEIKRNRIEANCKMQYWIKVCADWILLFERVWFGFVWMTHIAIIFAIVKMLVNVIVKMFVDRAMKNMLSARQNQYSRKESKPVGNHVKSCQIMSNHVMFARGSKTISWDLWRPNRDIQTNHDWLDQ